MTRDHSLRKPTTIAEAIHAVERARGSVENGLITMHVGRMNMPAGKHLHLVVLEYELLDKSTFIPLQSGNMFCAIESSNVKRREYPVELLDGGMVSHDANVRLQDGTTLRAVEITSVRPPHQLSPMVENIIHATISIANIRSAVYRSFRHGLSEEDAKRIMVEGDAFFEFIEYGEFIDGFKFIDFAKLAEVEKPRLKLKHVQRRFIELFPAAKIPSEQKISDTLALIGLWNPKRRPKS